MKEHRFSWYISFTVCFFSILFSLLICWLGVRNRLDGGQPLHETFIDLHPGSPVAQTFTAKHDYINIVILQFKNPGLANRGDFRFFLTSEDGEVLVERPFSGLNIGDPSNLRFQFEPISPSRDKNYTVSVEATSSDEPSVSIGVSRKGELNFSAYYRVLDKKTALVDLLDNLGQAILSDRIFLFLWGFVIFLLMGAGIIQIRKTK